MKRADLVTCALFVGIPDAVADRLADLVDYIDNLPGSTSYAPGVNRFADLVQSVNGVNGFRPSLLREAAIAPVVSGPAPGPSWPKEPPTRGLRCNDRGGHVFGPNSICGLCGLTRQQLAAVGDT